MFTRYTITVIDTISDQEGNSFEVVHYHPALGRFSGSEHHPSEDSWQTEGDLEEEGGKVNAVCVN